MRTYKFGMEKTPLYNRVKFLRPNKNIPVFRVTQFYLNLLVQHRIFSGFLEIKYNSMYFERRNAFQNALDYIFFSRKKI